MFEGLEPSISLTGGPWYTDNELDTEFIQHLTEVCYKFVRDTVSRSIAFISFLPLYFYNRPFQSAKKVGAKGHCMQYLIHRDTPLHMTFDLP
jgi:hypothetical protein